ncbi:hypothetical protein BGZ61DRAFT_30491 [Ilyonectria robusta]|uniref:uncharacterized protein n=1 Tax=Ilyonectria robusta TaxID=1079257 RepID=UPI001E8CDA63|nr:uncharacterized protein BGZ61DRAFT_30491 [Ilyonectria robusta]KAH8738327.1 hypothetical protein BGZ61DRAFT_30491 [Ilyonectria robusta]
MLPRVSLGLPRPDASHRISHCVHRPRGSPLHAGVATATLQLQLTRCLWSHLHAVSNSPTAGLLRGKSPVSTSVRSGRHRAWNDTRVSLILCLVNFSASTPSHQNPNYTTHQARRVKSRGSHAPARGPPSYDWECAEARSARYVRMRFQHDATREGGVEHRQSVTSTWIFLARDTLIQSIAPDLPSGTISVSIALRSSGSPRSVPR